MLLDKNQEVPYTKQCQSQPKADKPEVMKTLKKISELRRWLRSMVGPSHVTDVNTVTVSVHITPQRSERTSFKIRIPEDRQEIARSMSHQSMPAS